MVERIASSPSIVANPSDLVDDTLHGADEIAEYLHGDREQNLRETLLSGTRAIREY
jgi:hypothetical protein